MNTSQIIHGNSNNGTSISLGQAINEMVADISTLKSNVVVINDIAVLTLPAAYPQAIKGQKFRVTAGQIGTTGPILENGDLIIAINDNPVSGNYTLCGANFIAIQKDIAPSTLAILLAGTSVVDYVTPKVLADQGITFGASANTFTGDLSATAMKGGNGTAALPSHSFTSDPDTGIIDSSANVLGFVTGGTEQWIINASGSLVPSVATNDIGFSAAPVEKIYSQNQIIKGIDANGFFGLMTRKFIAAKVTLGAEPTEITMNIPAGAKLIGVQFTVSETIVAATATSWKASFTGGSTAVINAGTNAFAVNTKLNVLLSETTMAATAVTTGTTQISIISDDASDFTSGEISAICYYEELTSITD